MFRAAGADKPADGARAGTRRSGMDREAGGRANEANEGMAQRGSPRGGGCSISAGGRSTEGEGGGEGDGAPPWMN